MESFINYDQIPNHYCLLGANIKYMLALLIFINFIFFWIILVIFYSVLPYKVVLDLFIPEVLKKNTEKFK